MDTQVTYLDSNGNEQQVLCSYFAHADKIARFLAELPLIEQVMLFDGHHGQRYHRHAPVETVKYYLSIPDEKGLTNLASETLLPTGEKTYQTLQIPFAKLQHLVAQYASHTRQPWSSSIG